MIGQPELDGEGRIVAARGALQRVDELIAARDETRRLAQRLKDTLESMGDAFFTLDRDWRITYVNREFERIIGVGREALIGNNVWEVFPLAAGSEFQQRYREVLALQRPARFEAQYAGSGQWLSMSAFPSADGLAIHFRDISEERQRDDQMRLVQGHLTQRDELDRIRHALEQKQRVRAELINYTRAREPMWLELDIVSLLDASGRCTHFVSVERDIGDRKRVEAELYLSEERFKLAARASNDVIWDLDIARDRLWWNENLLSVFGHAPESLEPGLVSWTSRIHPEDRDGIVAEVEAAIAGGDASWTSEYRFLRADGSRAIVVDRGYIYRDAEGRALRMVGSMLDISTQRLQEERQQQSQRLEAVGQLTGGVAHDFNNLLTVIIGHGELLAERLGGDPLGIEMATTVLQAAERGAELTSRLLAVARRQPLEPQILDCNRLLERMLTLLRRTLRVDIDLSLRCADDLWAADVDPGQLEVALLNLVLNARDALPQGGRAFIESSNVWLDASAMAVSEEVRAGAYVLLSVSDTGVGIAAEHLDRVFEPFFTTKASGQGSGLGLSMVYGFIRQSGGLVRIYSEAGQGTRVCLYLPRAASGDLPVVADSEEPLMAAAQERVLVVEDDPHVRRHVEGLLRGLGYRVQVADTAAAALALLRSDDDFELLFTDVVMPGGMNGAELAEAARALRRDLPVLFTSGYTEDALIHHGRLDAGVHLLSKPYRRHALARKLREALGSTRALD